MLQKSERKGTQMTQAKNGNQVKVRYTGKLTDGTEFDASPENAPLEFTIGKGEVIPGFEQAVEGMSAGEKKTVTLSSDQAYGPHREEMVAEIERKNIPDDLKLEIGNQLEVTQENGHPFLVKITSLTEETVTLDANHPLAGQELVFDIELLEIA
jgi:peptidylprolyl isomerase